jgi:hypothetical protein
MSPTTRLHRRVFGATLVLSGLLPAVGFLLLPAIGWPDSAQGMSAAEALPRIAANEAAFRLGFLSMVVGGLAFLPASLYLLHILRRPDRPASLLLQVATAFAIASATLRTLWYAMSLTTFPVLQDLSEGADAATVAGVEVFYVAVNDVLSTVQEDIGVNVFGGVLLVLLAALIRRSDALPRWTAVPAAVAGVCYLLSTSEFLGIPNGSILPVLGPVLSSLWFMAVGVLVLRRQDARVGDRAGAAA